MGGKALLFCSGALLLLAGCGGQSSTSASPAAQQLQREDLVAISHSLKQAGASVTAEARSARTAWRMVANGLPADVAAVRGPVATATAGAERLQVPALLKESHAKSLAGPAGQLGGLFRSFAALSTRGWSLTGASIDQIEHGSPAAARFARDNVALYIESVYDGHFSLAQVGKKLTDGYRKLGGPAAFGSSLTQGEVDALARIYSEESLRLHPHVGVRLGS